LIRTKGARQNYRTLVASDAHQVLTDAPVAKGGGGEGFGPHELLEAALASCLNMSVRMQAAALELVVDNVRTAVSIDRSRDEEATFSYAIDFDSSFGDEERAQLIAAAVDCPVIKTLRKRLVFTPAPQSLP
jgi:putative redox protein